MTNPFDETVEATCGCGWRRTFTPNDPTQFPRGTARSGARYAAYLHTRSCGKYLPRIGPPGQPPKLIDCEIY